MSTDLDPLFKRLHLANARRVWRDLVRRAELEEWSYEQLLTTLISEEVAHRRGTRLHRAVRSAQFPFLRTIEEFDFSYQSTLRLTTFGSLLSPDFITEGHSVILEGKPGRGKTHLAIAIAYRAMQNGFEALFVNCAELIDDLSCASRRGELRDALMRYLRPHVLVVDEVGYLAYGDDAANVLFHVVNERHIKKRAMVFTTNKKPKRWGPVLHDDDLAEAIVDRILDRGRLLRLDGPSLRTKHLAGDTSLDDDQDEPGDRRVSGTNTAEFPEPTPGAGYRPRGRGNQEPHVPPDGPRGDEVDQGARRSSAAAAVHRRQRRLDCVHGQRPRRRPSAVVHGCRARPASAAHRSRVAPDEQGGVTRCDLHPSESARASLPPIRARGTRIDPSECHVLSVHEEGVGAALAPLLGGDPERRDREQRLEIDARPAVGQRELGALPLRLEEDR